MLTPSTRMSSRQWMLPDAWALPRSALLPSTIRLSDVNKPTDPEVKVVYGRLWRYVTPHKLVGFIAILSMTMTAVIEAGLVSLLAPLTDETLVAKNLETSRWIPYAFFVIFILRGLSGFGTELSLGWIGRRVISDLRRHVFAKLLTLPMSFFDKQAAGPLLS